MFTSCWFICKKTFSINTFTEQESNMNTTFSAVFVSSLFVLSKLFSLF